MSVASPVASPPRILGEVQKGHVVSTVKKQRIVMESLTDTDDDDANYETAGEESETTWVSLE